MKTAADFLARWQETVGALLIKGFRAEEIEVCLGNETASRFGPDSAVLAALGPHKADGQNRCFWGGIQVMLADAPRLCMARPKITALQARQKARK